MDSTESPPRYHAYMLRMWKDRPEGSQHDAVWRFQVEDPHTGRRRGFNDLAALFAYLQEVMAYEYGGGSGSVPGQTPEQQ